MLGELKLDRPGAASVVYCSVEDDDEITKRKHREERALLPCDLLKTRAGEENTVNMSYQPPTPKGLMWKPVSSALTYL